MANASGGFASGNIASRTAPGAAPGVASAISQVQDLRSRGLQVPQELIDRALNEQLDQQAAQHPHGLQGMSDAVAGPTAVNPFNPTVTINPADRMANMPGIMDHSYGTPPPAYTGPSLGTGGMQGAGAGVKNIWDVINSIGKSTADAANQQQAQQGAFDPLSELAKIQAMMPQYHYNGPDAQTMAQQEFNPQFAALQRMAQVNGARYNYASQRLGGLNDAYANQIAQGAKQNTAAFDQGGKDINSAYNGAADSATQHMNASTDEMAKQLAVLGQNQAAPDVFQNKQNLLSQQLGNVAKAQSAATGLNAQLKANNATFDNNRVGVAQQQGVNSQNNLLMNFLGQQFQNDQQGLALQGQMGAAANKYNMDIAQLGEKSAADQAAALGPIFRPAMTYAAAAGNTEVNQARADLALKQWQATQQGGGYNNAYDRLLNDAQGVYNDPTQANNAAQTVLNAYLQNPGTTNMTDLMGALDPQWLAQPGNQQLAYDYFASALQPGNKGL